MPGSSGDAGIPGPRLTSARHIYTAQTCSNATSKGEICVLQTFAVPSCRGELPSGRPLRSNSLSGKPEPNDPVRCEPFDANLWGADLQGANLTEANLYGANLRRVNASQAQFAIASCKRATLEGALLTDAYCGEVDLKDADITPKDLEKARQGNVLACTETSLRQETFSQAAMDHLGEAVQAFMTAYGFAYNGIIDTTHCPFFQLVKFWSNHPCTVDKLERIYEAGKQGLQHAFANQHDEISAHSLGVVSTRLAAALVPFTDILLRLGELIVLKMTIQGQPHLCVTSLSADLAHELALHPALLRNPAEAMSFAIKVCQLQRQTAG